jgi:spore coat protein U-like protein
MKKIVLAVSFLAILSGVAAAETATANLTVSANVASACSITGGTVAFGSYQTSSALPKTASGTISVTCTLGTIATVTLGQGSNPAPLSSDLLPLRRMTDGAGHYLSYSLYQDVTRLLVLGGVTGVGLPYIALSGSATNLTVYGSMAPLQDVPAGTYTDTVVATITF